MTSPRVESWTRRPIDVEALPLDGLHALHVGERWLAMHGLEVAHRHPAVLGRALLVPVGPGGAFRVARIGQRLIFDAVTGRPEVLDEDEFLLLHERTTARRAPVTACDGVEA